MGNEDIEKLNSAIFDWCYNCAEDGCKTSIQKMFAWIVCFLLKNDNAHYWFENKVYKSLWKWSFNVDLNAVLNENEAIKKYLYKKKYWKFLKNLVYKHVIDKGILVNKETLISLNHPKIFIEKNIVRVVYDFTESSNLNSYIKDINYQV